MRNQNLDIPAHLQPKWDEVTEQLRAASEELQKAQSNYHNAILARIALTSEINTAFEQNDYAETYRIAG